MRQVTRDEFFVAINPLNVHPDPTGRYPYTTEWRMQDGTRRLVGVSRSLYEATRYRWPPESEYFLVESPS